MNVLTAKYIFVKGTLNIKLSGEIDHHSAKTVREEIDYQILFNNAKNLELDLSDIGFMDSSGLGLILGRYTKIKELGGNLKIINPGKSAQRVLKLAATENIIPVEWIDGKKA